MQILTICPYLIGPGEPVHQSVNRRNNSDVSAGDKFWDAGLMERLKNMDDVPFGVSYSEMKTVDSACRLHTCPLLLLPASQ